MTSLGLGSKRKKSGPRVFEFDTAQYSTVCVLADNIGKAMNAISHSDKLSDSEKRKALNDQYVLKYSKNEIHEITYD